jgi:hypothetical protein
MWLFWAWHEKAIASEKAWLARTMLPKRSAFTAELSAIIGFNPKTLAWYPGK